MQVLFLLLNGMILSIRLSFSSSFYPKDGWGSNSSDAEEVLDVKMPFKTFPYPASPASISVRSPRAFKFGLSVFRHSMHLRHTMHVIFYWTRKLNAKDLFHILQLFLHICLIQHSRSIGSIRHMMFTWRPSFADHFGYIFSAQVISEAGV